MDFKLTFKDKNVENEFTASQINIQQKGYLLLTGTLVTQCSGIYFSNPLEINIFNPKIFFTFMCGMLGLILGYLLIKLKFPGHAETGIWLYIFSSTISAGEIINLIKSSIFLDTWVYFLLGANINIGCLFLLISRIRWTYSFSIIASTHLYYWFRVLELFLTAGARRTAFISLTIHMVIVLGLIYSNEKEIRTNFQKIRIDIVQSTPFEELIKKLLEFPVIVMRDDEALFLNKSTEKVLGVHQDSGIIEFFKAIKIVSIEDSCPSLSINLIQEVDEAKNSKQTNLYDHYKDLELQARLLRRNSCGGAKQLIGELHASGEAESFSIQMVPTHWKGKMSIIIIMTDITFIKNKFTTLNLYKDNLLATVSHDLRAPLNGILGILEILNEELDDPIQKDKLEIAIASGKLLHNMINDILDFSLISKGRLRLKFETTNISTLLEEVTSIMALQAKLKGLQLEVENFLRGSENYLVDSNRLRQVLLNLISNAIKFTSQGVVKVRIREENIQTQSLMKFKPMSHNDELKEEDEINNNNFPESLILERRDIDLASINLDRKRLIFEVEDTGVGIKPEEIGRLFQLFSRVTSGHKNDMDGIGLGLAISQSLVILMNSNRQGALISVRSEFGKGSLFRFPIYIDNEPSETFKEWEGNTFNYPLCFKTKEQIFKKVDERSSKSPVGTEGDCLFIPKKKKILVVDDDQINLVVAKTYLKSLEEEFTYLTVNNGKAAIEEVKAHAQNELYFDIILMDCVMPIMDGYEASKILKSMMNDRLIPWIPIVAITANSTVTDKQKCYECGMDLFLTKPYMKSDLIKIIEEAASVVNNE